MAAKPVMLPARDAGFAFWEQFRAETSRELRECNATAGHPLWTISSADASPSRFTVYSTVCAGDAVECSFDFERGILACVPGPAVKAKPVQFQWIEGNVVTLDSDGRSITMREALRLVLDELVCIDEESL